MRAESESTANRIYALAFGLFLGLCLWKFGNPVILDHKIDPPATPAEFWAGAWPTHWAGWIFLPFAIAGAFLIFRNKSRWPAIKWLWLLPLLWVGWQFLSAVKSVDSDLAAATLWQFAGCATAYFLGAFLLGTPRALNLLLIGILAAFAFCLVRAIDQRLVEFPQNQQMLVDGERTGWTNIPPQMLSEMKHDGVVITTNSVDIANPVVLAKFTKGRVMGTLVYPNALAGAILLLLPVSLALAFGAKKLRPAIRALAIALTIFLGGAGLFWSGSKLGWLIAMGIGGLYLLRLNWPRKLKFAAVTLVAVLGLGIFAVRFHNYFSAGATSVGARFDYWRAAVQTTGQNPLIGTGPGSFQRPYAKIRDELAAKYPQKELPEMARLTHNDYLEQFSDSGIPGGIFYATWIILTLAAIGRRVWKTGNQIRFAIYAGALGWFIQGVGEFGLYIPALAWTAFTLLGCALASARNQFDKNRPAG